MGEFADLAVEESIFFDDIDLELPLWFDDSHVTPHRTVMKASPVKLKPLWTIDDGITFSLLSKFIICRHRFWTKAVLGLKEDRGFDHKSEYGNLLHAAFEAFAAAPKTKLDFNARVKHGIAGIDGYVKEHEAELMTDAQELRFWTKVAKAQFAHYANHWQKKDSVRHYIAQEMVFDVPTILPSGRTIRLRGKIDELFRTPSKKSGKDGPLTLQENKCKGRIDEDGLMMSLHADLQTMLYLHCLDLMEYPTKKVLYNVILRPNGGGMGNQITQRKGRGNAKKGIESTEEFCTRVSQLPTTDPKMFYQRFNIELTAGDIARFRQQTLYPILEQLYDWWDSIKANPADPWNTQRSRDEMENDAPGFTFVTKPNPHHFVRPFGVYDSLSDGMRGEYFSYITTGGQDKSGLKRMTSVFPELDDPSLAGLKAKKK